ncbi:MAG: hypothetical protein IKB65_09570 [Ruminiclostridium sp.]|nr:hypothetical protein [Ruminiclostridium sp.]
MDNAFEAWAAAIRYCNDIKDGKATLQYQKNFVSSLHNAVELIMKQMLLNNNDHSIAEVRKPKNEADAKLLLDYFRATNLNRFFESLSDDELSKFHTIQFNELISSHKRIFGSSLEAGETLKTELMLLQQLRNNETHFMIRQGSFLSENDFRTLHNFMVRFYKIMKKWNPVNGDNLESSIFLYLYWYSPDKDDSMYEFECELLQDFSYETAVRNSKLAKAIAEILKDNHQCGAPDFSPYDIAFDLMNGYHGLSAQFDEIWAMVYMMQSLELIVIKDILDDEHGQVHYSMSVSL